MPGERRRRRRRRASGFRHAPVRLPEPGGRAGRRPIGGRSDGGGAECGPRPSVAKGNPGSDQSEGRAAARVATSGAASALSSGHPKSPPQSLSSRAELSSSKERHGHLGNLLRTQIPGPTPEIMIQCVWGGAEQSACLRSIRGGNSLAR